MQIRLVDIAFDVGQKIIPIMNEVYLGIGKVVLGNTNRGPPCHDQVFVKALRVDYGLDILSLIIHTLEIILAIM